ncbi:MAG: efflux transporter, family, subunit [Gemmatimonadetes bacterium]|nr:efflux transporter, family, subunit [Gemmatimonadota bacterium]
MITRFRRPIPSCALLLLGSLAACTSTKSETSADTAKPAAASSTTPQNVTLTADQRKRIQIVTVQPTAYSPVVEATGNVAFNGDKSTQVLSPVSGPVTRVIGNPGMVVNRGQPLAYVSSPDFATAVADYRKAQTAFRNAKRIADRDSALFKNDALARGELEQAQSDVASAEADLEAAVQNMRALGVEESQIQNVKEGKPAPIEAIIRSPIDGTIVEKLVAQGQLLQAGTTPVFTVADLSTMWVMTSVFANDLKDVAVGQPADVITDVTQVPIPGRVDYIASLADPASKAVSVRVVAPNNNHVLRRDMFVRVQIRSRQEHRGILVPVSSVLRDDQNLPYVFVAAGPNAFARRSINLGSRVGDKYEILTGLAGGDQVVADGALFLQFAESQ